MGQIEGPLAAPTKWGVQTVDYRARASGRAEQLLPAPGNQERYAAFAIPTARPGRTSSREDWAKCGQNEMTPVEDTPSHYNADRYVESANAFISVGAPDPAS